MSSPPLCGGLHFPSRSHGHTLPAHTTSPAWHRPPDLLSNFLHELHQLPAVPAYPSVVHKATEGGSL